MNVPDVIFAVGGFMFMMALLPSVFSKDDKPNIWTSIITSTILLVFSITYFSIDLELAGYVTFITGILWLVLATQSFRKQWEIDVKEHKKS